LLRAINDVLANPLNPNGPKLIFSVLRVPFFLEPDYPDDIPYVETNRERPIRKWGGVDQWERQKRSHDLKGRGEEAGIPYFNLDRLTSHTMASHRLIQHIGKAFGLNISEALYDRLNVYYFVEGHSLNDKPRLAEIASETLRSLLPESEHDKVSVKTLLDFLRGSEGRKEIGCALQKLRELGVYSIPKFIIEGQAVVDGAAHHSVFTNVFRSIERKGKSAGGPIFGKILGVSDHAIQQGSYW